MTQADNHGLLRRAADLLLSGAPRPEWDSVAGSLLHALGYDPPDPSGPNPTQDETAHRARLLAVAADFPRLFQLDSTTAPGLVFFGAELATPVTLSASGAGPTFRAAFEGCVGEGIELSSQFVKNDDNIILNSRCAGPRWAVRTFQPALPAAVETDWVEARRLTDGGTVYVPTDMVFRRGAQRRFDPPHPLSIGCAAGPTLPDAILHALLELIERDAAALWWRGGRRGRLLPLDSPASIRASELLAAARMQSRQRRCWLLDITSDLGVPSVAAVSVDGDGLGFACGVAARLTMVAAAQAAIREMCQMELAREVVAAKRRERGEAGLNAFDLAHERRARAIDAAHCVLLHPLPRMDALHDIAPDTGVAADRGTGSAPDAFMAVRGLVHRLKSRGIDTAVIDLTRPEFGVPVARVLCPGLESEPSTRIGDRLLGVMAETGGGEAQTHGVPLM